MDTFLAQNLQFFLCFVWGGGGGQKFDAKGVHFAVKTAANLLLFFGVTGAGIWQAC